MKNVFRASEDSVSDGTDAVIEPLIVSWGLYFREDDGVLNRLEVLEDFTNFWNNPEEDTLILEGRCYLAGTVFGKSDVSDESGILTSQVMMISRVEHKADEKVSYDLFCIETQSGSEYFVYSNDLNAYMEYIMREMTKYGTLRHASSRYVSNNKFGLF